MDAFASDQKNGDAHKSGRLLLLYCVHDSQKHYTNIITPKNNHNGSKGTYYSHGNKANFGIVNGSSVSQYAYKMSKNMKIQSFISQK